MNRRTSLGVAEAAFLAGWSADGGTETLDQQGDTDTDAPETDTLTGTEPNRGGTDSPSATETKPETETETATPESEDNPGGAAEVAIQRRNCRSSRRSSRRM